MPIPHDYEERVYAGVLGKIIGVYLGRPFEGWHYNDIIAKLGQIDYYVHEKLNVPLIVTDDDISGTFTFLRALDDYDCDPNLTPEQIGQSWMNYLIENRTVLWWGGMGNSTEHTAYLRLKNGITAPASGAIATNGRVVAEQIGAQIFIDGWAMVCPGDPARAADFARRAASVSHDGEAIYGAQVVAAIEAAAFVEKDMDKLIDTAVALIPADSLIARMIADIRGWYAEEKDWRKNREKLEAKYGYDKYGGGCHMIPNHGLIILSLLHGEGDFSRALMIVNTGGWDTDCNAANVGCIMGIRNGLAGIDNGPDWRGPVADRMYLPTADGGRAISDAVAETYHIVRLGRKLAGMDYVAPKSGARFHFALPGSVQSWLPEQSIESRGTTTVENEDGTLAIRFRHVANGRYARAAAATFVPEDAAHMPGYGLVASPTLYPGQTVRAEIKADTDNNRDVTVRLYIRAYGAENKLERIYGPDAYLSPGAEHAFAWKIPQTDGQPIAEIGLEVSSDRRADGTIYLDYLTWDGSPTCSFPRPKAGDMWRRAWVDGADHFETWGNPYKLVQDTGTGLIIQGTREWHDYTVTATVNAHMAASTGIAARVQGMARYYALLLCNDGQARLVRALDGEMVLAQADYPFEFDKPCVMSLTMRGFTITGSIGGKEVFSVEDSDHPLAGGGIALICAEGNTAFSEVSVTAL